MEKCCGSCLSCQTSNNYSSYDPRKWCDKWHQWVYADKLECSTGYSESPYVSSSQVNQLIKEARDSRNSGCYLTTITCYLLGYPDNNEYLQKLRFLRNNVMQKDPKYFGLLAQYDIVGPMIVRKLLQDPERGMIAKNLLELGIKATTKQVDEKNYEEAVRIYATMTELLIDGCKIKTAPITQEYIDNMDVEKSGHGKVIMKQKPNPSFN